MKNLMLSTAILVGLAGVAGAQTETPMFRGAMDAMEIRGSDFIGKRVYATETAMDGTAANGLQDGWEDIGEINDVILTRDGKVAAVLVDIGGFLGMGERQVAVDMSAVRFVADDATADAPDDYFLVMNAARADLEAAPAYATTAMKTEPAATADNPVTEEITGAAMPERTPMVRDGFMAATPEIMTAEMLTGARVYDANDEWIGEIGKLVLDESGQITDAVIDVGGFLGIGEKPVALPIGQIDILKQENGDELRVYIGQSKDDLKAMPAFAG